MIENFLRPRLADYGIADIATMGLVIGFLASFVLYWPAKLALQESARRPATIVSDEPESRPLVASADHQPGR
jgi:hypothetical protein